MSEDETKCEDEIESSARIGAGAASPTECAVCGDAIEATEWHPVVSGRDEDGEVTIHTFCSEACREKWDDS